MKKQTPLPPAGRPREFSDEEVLDKAMRIFWQRGYESTSLEELEAGTGLSRSSLYNAFGSKRALFERAMDRYASERKDGLIASLRQGTRGLEDVQAFFEGLGESLSKVRRKRGCFMVNAMIEFGGSDPVVARKGSAYFARVQRAFSAALIRAANLGEIGRAQIDDRARLLVTLAMGMNVQARAGSSRADLVRLAKAACLQTDAWRLAQQ